MAPITPNTINPTTISICVSSRPGRSVSGRRTLAGQRRSLRGAASRRPAVIGDTLRVARPGNPIRGQFQPMPRILLDAVPGVRFDPVPRILLDTKPRHRQNLSHRTPPLVLRFLGSDHRFLSALLDAGEPPIFRPPAFSFQTTAAAVPGAWNEPQSLPDTYTVARPDEACSTTARP